MTSEAEKDELELKEMSKFLEDTSFVIVSTNKQYLASIIVNIFIYVFLTYLMIFILVLAKRISFFLHLIHPTIICREEAL